MTKFLDTECPFDMEVANHRIQLRVFHICIISPDNEKLLQHVEFVPTIAVKRVTPTSHEFGGSDQWLISCGWCWIDKDGQPGRPASFHGKNSPWIMTLAQAISVATTLAVRVEDCFEELLSKGQKMTVHNLPLSQRAAGYFGDQAHLFAR